MPADNNGMTSAKSNYCSVSPHISRSDRHGSLRSGEPQCPCDQRRDVLFERDKGDGKTSLFIVFYYQTHHKSHDAIRKTPNQHICLMLKHTHDCNSRFSSSIQLTFLFYPILPWMSVKPSRMTGPSPAHGIICSSSNPIIVYTCDGISQVKLITQPISVMSVASSGQLCWLGKSITRQVLQLVSIEKRRSSILKDPQHVCSR